MARRTNSVQMELEKGIRTAKEKCAEATNRLAVAADSIDRKADQIEALVDRHPQFVEAQSRYHRIEQQVAHRMPRQGMASLESSISELTRRFGRLGVTNRLNSSPLETMSMEQLQQAGVDAYRTLRDVRHKLASEHLETFTILRTEVLEAERELDNALQRLERLTSQYEQFNREPPRRTDGAPLPDLELGLSTTPYPPTPTASPEENRRIARLLEQRGVTQLVHFTRLDAVPHILKHGLIPRKHLLDETTFAPQFNDPLRLDRRLECSCISISRINWLVFRQFSRWRFPEARWCIIGFKPDVVVRHRSVFCCGNAAATDIVTQAERASWTVDGLARMFEDPVLTPSGRAYYRSQLVAGGLPDNVPSNPQAEVLVHGIIAPGDISSVTFRNCVDLDELSSVLRTHNSATESGNKVIANIEPSAFEPREDSGFWKRY